MPQIIRISEYGGPEVMHLEDVPMPTPGPGQVLVRVAAAGVNFTDIEHRRGALADVAFYGSTLPSGVGHEGAGEIIALGPDVTGWRQGERVAWVGVFGSYSTHLVAPVALLIRVPRGVRLEQAAAALLQGMTAHALAFSVYPFKRGDWCLIQSAAGGLGQLLCQMVRMRGVRVVGVTSTPEKAQVAARAGAEATIVSTRSDIADEVRRITDGTGVTVVYDGVGQATFDANLTSLAPRGYLVLYGQSSGRVSPVDPLALMERGSLFLTRFAALHYLRDPRERQQRLDDLFSWLRTGKLRVRIDCTFALSDAAAAHVAVEQRQTSGKVLLLPEHSPTTRG